VPQIGDRESIIEASERAGADDLIANLPDGYDTAPWKVV